tara:strand:- start:140 stop:805 length:666 start_codon:yes stop_codon:yes gene_type:complete
MKQSENLYSKNNSDLLFRNVSFSWQSNGVSCIKNCNFNISGGGLWMIVGKNGCGKSTLFKLIKGVLQPDSGLIQRPANISMVFQNPDHQILMPSCASELILNINRILSKKEIDKKVDETLNFVGLPGFLKRPVHTLSGGQKQRLAIASALISDSKFLLMDEPTALLDEFSQKQILEIIKNLTASKIEPFTVLWITHRMEELQYANHIASMKNGRLSEWKNA